MTTVPAPTGAPAGAPTGAPTGATAVAAAPAAATTPAAPATPVNTNTLRLYEGMFVIDPILAAKEWDKVNATLTTMITKNKGDIKIITKWTERKLAYAIRRQRRGTYVITYFVAPMDAIPKIRRECQISESILRSLFIAHPLAKDVPGVPPPPPPLKEFDDSRPSEAGRMRPRRPF
ncbi:MAG: 30S ribosomal protein S6 [Planctomycetes bacterium]|nr:30S ribosomal protein S6 [Planctomycetota bacterium]